MPKLIALLALLLLPLAEARAQPPAAGAFETGHYRNLFAEWDPRIGETEVRARLDAYWASLFGEDPERRVYYPAAANANGASAYILDVLNDDVRSEGMSYGMMIAVQMDRRQAFDALWNWARSHMRYEGGPRAGCFRWHAVARTDRLQAFFEAQGMAAYPNRYRIDGTPLSSERSDGLIAANGAASLAAAHPRRHHFVAALWALEPPRGRGRYYDGLLQFMAMLHASGHFRVH